MSEEEATQKTVMECAPEGDDVEDQLEAAHEAEAAEAESDSAAPAEEPKPDNAEAAEGDDDAEVADDEDGEKPKKKAEKERSPSPPPRRKAPGHAPPPPPPKAYDVPADTWSTKPVSTRVWEVDEETIYEEKQEELDLSGTELVAQYNLGAELGRGFFAVVKTATNKQTNEKVAVKVIEKANAPQFGAGGLVSELDILNKLNHTHIIKGKGLLQSDDYLMVLLELAEGGELVGTLKKNVGAPYSEANVHQYATQLAGALAHVHEKGIIHGDLAPENLLLSGAKESSDLKLAGFSGSLLASGAEESAQLIGNAEFQAPEIIMNQGFSQAADLWSFGCVLYYLVEGCSPFQDSNTMRMNMKIRQGKFEFGNAWATVSQSLKDLISQLIRVEANGRLSAAKITEHPWITGNPGSGAPLPNTRQTMANN